MIFQINPHATFFKKDLLKSFSVFVIKNCYKTQQSKIKFVSATLYPRMSIWDSCTW